MRDLLRPSPLRPIFSTWASPTEASPTHAKSHQGRSLLQRGPGLVRPALVSAWPVHNVVRVF